MYFPLWSKSCLHDLITNKLSYDSKSSLPMTFPWLRNGVGGNSISKEIFSDSQDFIRENGGLGLAYDSNLIGASSSHKTFFLSLT